MTDALILLIFPALIAFAAASDLLTMTIPNRVALGLIAGFFTLAIITGMAPATMAVHVGIAGAVLLAGFTCFAFGWIGGGDAKLAAATALWLGYDQVVNYLLVASIFGGSLTLLILQFRSWPLPPLLMGQGWLCRLHQEDAGVPYGLALAAAALLIYPDSAWMALVGL